ncbi:MAG: type II and III secretion system protein [Bacteroidota bacterium]
MIAVRIAAVLALVLGSLAPAGAQSGLSPAERKGVQGYTSPDVLVSISPSTPLVRAIVALGEVSRRSTGKIIVDTERRTMPIDIDIQAMPWRQALEAICRKAGIWFTEYDTYIQLSSGTPTSDPTGRALRPEGIMKEFATFRSREIKVSAVLFEVNLSNLDEAGINWNFMKSTDDFSINGTFQGGDRVTSEIFSAEVTPKLSFANISLIAKMFSTYNLGEVLSGPQVTVRSGEQGRIQVGQDFSIRERDFAGNLIDKFYSSGTIIMVTPQVINEQGVNFIHMDMEIERSSVEPGPISTLINKTKANTNLLLLDGEETIIGGLYSNETTNIRTGVPFLKDLPWWVLGLRYVFGYNREEMKKKELIILLRAELVPTLQERIAQKRGDRLYERWEDEQMMHEKRIRPRRER